MTTPARRPYAWLCWLLAFLAVELPAAIRHTGGTLSETIPRWYPTRARFLLLLQFLGVALPAHLYGMVVATLGEPRQWWSSAWLIAGSGAVAGSSIVYAELWERRSRVGLKDSVVKWFALKWLRGKVKEGSLSKVLKALDGWKLQISVLVLFGFKVYDAANNGHTGEFVLSVLSALNWLPAEGWTGESVTVAAASALAVFGFFAKLYKARQQSKAGAKMGELLTAEGYIKAGARDGTLAATIDVTNDDPRDPVVIKVEGVKIEPEPLPDLGKVTPPALKG